MPATPPSRSTPLARVVATAAIGVLQMGIAISLAALVFSGPLANGAGRASAGFILGSAIVAIVVGRYSSMSIVIVGAQDTAAIVIAAIATSLSTSSNIADDELVPTVLVLIALSGVLAGLTFWLIGRRNLTGLVRYLPWPVLTGFTAGTGWLLFRGGIEVMHGDHLPWSELGMLGDWSRAQFLVPGVLLAVMIVVVLSTRIPNTLISVAILLGAVVFHLVARSVSDLDRVEADGWLIGPFPEDAGWKPIGPSDLQATDWGALASNALPIAAVVAVSVIGVLLNLSSLETILDEEIAMDDELRITGLANIGVGISGGLIGWHLLGDTTMAERLGARGRAVPISIGVGFLAVFLFGSDLIALMPRAVAGGVLAGVGLNLLVDWFRATLPRLNRGDRSMSIVILAAMALLGVLPGVALGIALAAVAFIRRSSRIDPARHVLAATGRSNVDRSIGERSLLVDERQAILAAELQGFLFFGSTMRLRTMLEDHGFDQTGAIDDPPRFVVIDMERVTGIDSTAAASLGGLVAKLAASGVTTVFSSIDPDIVDELHRNGVVVDPLDDLDHAIAHCEERLLDHHLPDRNVRDFADAGLPPHLASRMDRRTIVAGDTLIATGDEGRELYVVQSGRFTTSVTGPDGRRTRLRQVLPGAVLGEVTFARRGRRTADVVADTDGVVLVLTRERFDDLRRTNPEMAIEFQQLLLERLANRLATTSAMVRDLLR